MPCAHANSLKCSHQKLLRSSSVSTCYLSRGPAPRLPRAKSSSFAELCLFFQGGKVYMKGGLQEKGTFWDGQQPETHTAISQTETTGQLCSGKTYNFLFKVVAQSLPMLGFCSSNFGCRHSKMTSNFDMHFRWAAKPNNTYLVLFIKTDAMGPGCLQRVKGDFRQE